MDYKKEIIKTIVQISGRYAPYEVFTDWIRCAALSISNSTQMIRGKVWEEREQAYIETASRHTRNM